MTDSHNLAVSQGRLCSAQCQECDRIVDVLPAEALEFIRRGDTDAAMTRWVLIAVAQRFDSEIARILRTEMITSGAIVESGASRMDGLSVAV